MKRTVGFPRNTRAQPHRFKENIINLSISRRVANRSKEKPITPIHQLQQTMAENRISRQGQDPSEAWDGYERQTDSLSEDSSEPSVARLHRPGNDIFRDESDDEADGFDMSLVELLYSTSSFYAIVVPGKRRQLTLCS